MAENKGGRPTKYKPDFARQAEKLCAKGFIDEELADFFGVAVSSIYEWKSKHPEFSEAIKRGKTPSDEEVERSLYERATGYRCVETKVFMHEGRAVTTDVIKQYPPDTGAAAFWLKNRRPKDWRDKRETDLNHGVKDEIGEFFSRIDGASKGLAGLRGEVQEPKVETE